MAVRALYCNVRQGFALPWLSVPHTVTAYTAVRAVYCHGCQKLYFHGSQGFMLSWLLGLYMVMALPA